MFISSQPAPRKKRLVKIVEDFVKNESLQEFHCSTALTKFERKQLHELATAAQLSHVSEGEGKKRHLVLKKCAAKRPLNDITNKQVNDFPNDIFFTSHIVHIEHY